MRQRLIRLYYSLENIGYVKREKRERGQSLKLIKTNSAYRNIHKGERCFILGNGPSLKDIDFQCLGDEIVFTVNFLPVNPNFGALKSNYHIISDSMGFKGFDGQDAVSIKGILRSINTQSNTPKCFFSLGMKEQIEQYGLNEILDINYFSHVKYFYDGCNKAFDYTKIMFDYESVVFTAISLAIYMGFSEIYLLGCDCTGIIADIESRRNHFICGHGYEMEEKLNKSIMIKAKSTPIDVAFHCWYRILRLYKEFKRYTENRKVKLINCTQNSIIEGVEYRMLDNVLLEKHEKNEHN